MQYSKSQSFFWKIKCVIINHMKGPAAPSQGCSFMEWFTWMKMAPGQSSVAIVAFAYMGPQSCIARATAGMEQTQFPEVRRTRRSKHTAEINIMTSSSLKLYYMLINELSFFLDRKCLYSLSWASLSFFLYFFFRVGHKYRTNPADSSCP